MKIKMEKQIRAVDLFCGAGGTSTGLQAACEDLGRRVDLIAINHWRTAIATHSANHRGAQHLCQNIDAVNPREVVPGGRLDLLLASPECKHHSNARGGKPIHDQSRVSAWHVLRWCEALRIENVLIENVKEFQTWGPLGADGRPLKRRRGETYVAFLNALRSLGYSLDARALNAADYGDPTCRERLFIIARRGRQPIVWPKPTHTPDGQETFEGPTQKWRPARDIIDWTLPGESIFTRTKPLAPNTMARIRAGLNKFCGLSPEWVQPFLVVLRNNQDARSVEKPVPTITTSGAHLALCEPFIIPYFGEREGQAPRVHSVDKPLPTVTGQGAGALVEPFLVKYNGTAIGQVLDQPLDTLTTKDRFGLVLPQVGAVLDIKFRMLQPHELARAMSFPEGYAFHGNRAQKVKQIGNAVPVNTARALCRSLLKESV